MRGMVAGGRYRSRFAYFACLADSNKTVREQRKKARCILTQGRGVAENVFFCQLPTCPHPRSLAFICGFKKQSANERQCGARRQVAGIAAASRISRVWRTLIKQSANNAKNAMYFIAGTRCRRECFFLPTANLPPCPCSLAHWFKRIGFSTEAGCAVAALIAV